LGVTRIFELEFSEGMTIDRSSQEPVIKRGLDRTYCGGRRLETSDSRVSNDHFAYLRRNPDSAPDLNCTGYDFWLAKLNHFNCKVVNAEMVKAFIISGEDRSHFGL
jgi:hypothetical protein